MVMELEGDGDLRMFWKGNNEHGYLYVGGSDGPKRHAQKATWSCDHGVAYGRSSKDKDDMVQEDRKGAGLKSTGRSPHSFTDERGDFNYNKPFSATDKAMGNCTLNPNSCRGCKECEGCNYGRVMGRFRILPRRMSAKHFSRNVRISLCLKCIVRPESTRTSMKIMKNTPQSCPLQHHCNCQIASE
ncbi:hypothetical protein Cgig2_025332 [Carnegiea gigantea]|uniref:Uncharacterized protein n=1 Tax=Carnegiea gigantea TaxID=171969 RepID=A0A9Q1K4A6_9CARY|nr:hypothetical protein Cgig2_025332 [Carnegiea gigantea]